MRVRPQPLSWPQGSIRSNPPFRIAKRTFWWAVILLLGIVLYISVMVHLFANTPSARTAHPPVRQPQFLEEVMGNPGEGDVAQRAAKQVNEETFISPQPPESNDRSSISPPSSSRTWLHRKDNQIFLLRVLSKQIRLFSDFLEGRLWGGRVESLGDFESIPPHLVASYIISGKLTDGDKAATSGVWRQLKIADETDDPLSPHLAASALPEAYFAGAAPLAGLQLRSVGFERNIVAYHAIAQESVQAAVKETWEEAQEVHNRILIRRAVKVNLRALFAFGAATLHSGVSSSAARVLWLKILNNVQLRSLVEGRVGAGVGNTSDMPESWVTAPSDVSEKVVAKILIQVLLGIDDEGKRVSAPDHLISVHKRSVPGSYPVATIHAVGGGEGAVGGVDTVTSAPPDYRARPFFVSEGPDGKEVPPYHSPIAALSIFTTIKPCFNEAIQFAQLDAISSWVGLPIITASSSQAVPPPSEVSERLPDQGVTVFLMVGGSDSDSNDESGISTDEMICSTWIADTINQRVAALVAASAVSGAPSKHKRLPPVVVVPRSRTPRGKHGTVLLGSSIEVVKSLTVTRLAESRASPPSLSDRPSGSIVFGFINADIILDPVSAVAIHRILDTYKEAFIVGKRRSVELTLGERLSYVLSRGAHANATAVQHHGLDGDDGMSTELLGDTLLPHTGWNRNPVFRGSVVERSDAEDYFFWTESFFEKKEIPDFHIGRPAYDNFLVHTALHTFKPVVDASAMLIAYHQKHDYQHLKRNDGDASNDKKRQWTYWGTEEADENRRLGERNGGWQHGVIDFIPIVFSNPAAASLEGGGIQLPNGDSVLPPTVGDELGIYRRAPGDIGTGALVPPTRHFRIGLSELLHRGAPSSKLPGSSSVMSIGGLLSLERGSSDEDVIGPAHAGLIYKIPNCAAQVEGSAVLESILEMAETLDTRLGSIPKKDAGDAVLPGQPVRISIQEMYDEDLREGMRRMGEMDQGRGGASLTDGGQGEVAELAHVREHLDHGLMALADRSKGLLTTIADLLDHGTNLSFAPGTNEAVRVLFNGASNDWMSLTNQVVDFVRELQQILRETLEILAEGGHGIGGGSAATRDNLLLSESLRASLSATLNAAVPSYRAQIELGGRTKLQRTLISTLSRAALSHDPFSDGGSFFGRDAKRTTLLLNSGLATNQLRKGVGDYVGGSAVFLRFECPLTLREGWKPLSDGQYGALDRYLTSYRRYQRSW